MAKDKKAKKAEQKARTAAKQAKKSDKKEKRHKAKGANDDSDAEDVDLDAVLAAYAEEQAKFLKVTEVPSGPPTPRSSSTLIASPSGRNELFVFGGEAFDGTTAKFYNNLYVYLIDKNEWREVTSPNSPLPRSGHAWCRGGNTGGIYLFGGEFSSPKQGTFYHYNDFWQFEPSSREWNRIESKKGPPSRSGHRMTYFKNYIILFGGFQDTSQQTKYLSDLWIYDCQKFTWFNPQLPPASMKPDPRSSFSFLPHESGAVLYGGYSRVKMQTGQSKGKKGGGGGGGAQKSVLKPMVHEDTWFLRITPPGPDAPATAGPAVRWEKRKKPANAPNPPRAGTTMAYHKGRAIMFGGVHDIEQSEEGIESEFFDTLHALNLERNRFFQLSLRRPRAGGKKQNAQKSRNRGKADEEELLRNLARLEAKANGGDMEETGAEKAPVEDEEEELQVKQSLPVRYEFPHKRFNAQLTVQDDLLFIFGGTFERGDQEFTFDDMYCVDLSKLDGVKEIFYIEPERWNDAIEAESDEDEDEDDDDDDDEEDDEEEVEDQESNAGTASAVPTKITEPTVDAEAEQEQETETTVKDNRPHPRPFESLRDFFTRTSTEWQDILLAKLREEHGGVEKSIKELRKDAFELADQKWWDCREEITALEDEMEEAGINEVVSLHDRANVPSAGRRR